MSGQTLNERKALLIKAVSYRESRCGKYNWNPTDSSAGMFGIRAIMVKEVNQILGYKKYKLNDRLNNKKALEMFIIYQNFVNPKWYLENGCRAWNAGRSWYKNKHTSDKYWSEILKDKIIKQ